MINWDAVGAVAELAGAIAVVATLIYLAGQVRQARDATMATVYQDRANARGEMNLRVALNCPNFFEILHRFEVAIDEVGVPQAAASLSDVERFLVSRYYQNIMIRVDNLCFQERLGLLPDSYAQTTGRAIGTFLPVWKEFGFEPFGELELALEKTSVPHDT